jgi:hypothetical protein
MLVSADYIGKNAREILAFKKDKPACRLKSSR